MNIKYSFVKSKDFLPHFKEKRNSIFNNDYDFAVQKILTSDEKEKLEINNERLKNALRLYLVAKLDNNIIGWSFGVQKGADEYYIINSAVLPEYRNQGVYTKMLEKNLVELKTLGFQRIYSKHKMSNNKILIPKLKNGFIITGFELNDVFGAMVELSYYTNQVRKELLEVRIGSKKPNAKISKLSE